MTIRIETFLNWKKIFMLQISMLQRELSSVTQGRRDTGSYRNHKNMKSIVIFFPQKLNEKEEKLSKLNVRTLKPME